MAIILEKDGDSHRINLEKAGVFSGEIKINLNWSKGGFFSRVFNGDVDLDLGCFYELNNGKKKLIDGLQFSHGRGGSRNIQSNQGCYTMEPYIWHMGDDRGGGASSGENILVNPAGVPFIKKMIVYTFIFDGAAKWSETNAVVRVSVPRNEDVVVEMGTQYSNKRFCAIAELDFDKDSINVKKLVTFHDGHSDCDKTYGWGFNYTPGTKD